MSLKFAKFIPVEFSHNAVLLNLSSTHANEDVFCLTELWIIVAVHSASHPVGASIAKVGGNMSDHDAAMNAIDRQIDPEHIWLFGAILHVKPA